MTLAQARELAGTERLWLAPGAAEKVLVGVRILGARVSYGRAQLRVEPLSGRGARWVDAEMTQGIDDA